MTGAPKWSAQGVAALRAAAYLEERALRHDDHLSVDFVDGPLAVLATTPLLRKVAWRFYDAVIPGIYGTHIARTRYIDARVREALAGGVRQYVILGAGLDSRPYRCAGPEVRCFEVDLEANSIRKQARVRECLGALPEHVAYVAGDLTRVDALAQALDTAGLEAAAPALFTLEGVSMYLRLDDLRAVLGWIARRPGRSTVVLDWFDDRVVSAGGNSPAMRRHFEAMASKGEPYTLGLDAASVADLARDLGFRVEGAVEGRDVDRTLLGDTPRWRRVRTVGFLGLAHLSSTGHPGGAAGRRTP